MKGEDQSVRLREEETRRPDFDNFKEKGDFILLREKQIVKQRNWAKWSTKTENVFRISIFSKQRWVSNKVMRKYNYSTYAKAVSLYL